MGYIAANKLEEINKEVRLIFNDKKNRPVSFKEFLSITHRFYKLGQQSRPKISDNSLELEQEILSYIRGMGFGYGGWVDGLEDEDLCKLARHFAEWGAENLKK